MECQIFFLVLFCLGISEIKGKSGIKSSLTFVIDDTFSMNDDIDEVKKGANDIFETVMNSKSSQIEDFVLVTFNDPDILLRTITKDRSDFKSALSRISVYGGDDCPEMAMGGIKLALEKSRDASLLYVFTDASAKDHAKFAEVEALSQRKQSQVVFVLTGQCGTRRDADYLVYHKLAKATSGQVFHLQKSEIGKILKYVTKTIESRKNVIASKAYPAGYGNSFDVEVDNHTKELVIAVSGRRPSVEVTDSKGTKMPTEDITRLSEIAVIRVINVKPDVYKVEVGSETDTAVTVSGTTSVHFEHGFSVLKPTSIDDTASRPVPEVKSYLSIKLDTESANVELKSVQILDMDDHIVLEEDLELVNEKEKFYITKPITSPNHMFKIAIKGYDTESETFLTRISLTPIKPQDPTVTASTPETVPVVTIDGGDEIDAEYDEPLQLKCKVSGYPKPDIVWESDDPIGKNTQTDSTIELPSNFVSVLEISKVNKNATYTCKAINKNGGDTKSISVKTKKKSYFNVLELPKDITIEYGKEGQINCKVDALPPASITWYKHNRILTSDGNIEFSADNSVLYIRSMAPYIADNYICEARNGLEREFAVFQVSISGVEPPKIDKTIYYVTAMKDSSVDIHCNLSKGKPKPTYTWLYHDQYSSSFSELEVTSDTIHINNVAAGDMGTYRCMVENVVGKDNHDIDLLVEYPPVITKSTSPAIVKNDGEKVTLECPVDGSPTPDVVWKLDGNELWGLTHKFFRDGSIQFTATLSDRGNYECEAKNDHGVVSIKTKVDVVEPPKIDKTIYYVTAMKDSSVDIHCNLSKGKPKPTYTWLYHDQYSSSFSELEVTSDTIHINNVAAGDMGTYRCMVENVVGKDNHDIDLLVEYPPVITKSTSPAIVKNDGEKVTLECPVDGSPTPDVVWKLDGNELWGLTHKFFRDGSIQFTATLSDRGNYECEAKNDHGVVSIKTKVDVVVPVNIEPPKRGTIEVMVGNYTILPCRADGFPEPVLSWVYYSKDPKVTPKPFIPSDSTGSLLLSRIQQDQEGFYTCIAKNIASSKNITYEVIVLAPAFITYSKKQFEAVVDDIILRVPCKASGKPTPTITWMRNGFNIPVGNEWYDMAEDGALIIKNLDTASSGSYVCQAKNKFGPDNEAFEVIVKPYAAPGILINTIKFKEGEAANIPCSVPHHRTDRLRWFKDGRLIAEGELQFPSVTSQHAGVYTCRVSSFTGAKTGTTKVVVGSIPQFISNEAKENIIEFIDGSFIVMDCSTHGELKPEVKWLRDGADMDYDELMYVLEMNNPSVKGRYTCIVSNEFGNAQKEFVIQTLGCKLDIKNDFNGNTPLMLTPYLELPKFEVTDGHVNVPREENIVLYCSADFNIVPKKEIMVSCENNKEFNYEGTKYLYSDLKCRNTVEPIPKRTGRRCSEGNTELVEIGFEIRKKFIQIYQVCLDLTGMRTLYSKLNLQPTLANALPNYGFNNGSYGDLNTIYDCNYQNNEISVILGIEFHLSDGCCFEKRQLVNAKDVAPGLSQISTYTSVNVVPHWSTCNSQNWDDVEQRIRTLAMTANHELLVWTGVAQNLELPDTFSTLRNVTLPLRKKKQPVPKYLWKVVQDPATKASLAIIQVNVPDLELKEAWHYRLCSDVCGDVEWMQSSRWRNVYRGYTYCCSLSDFERAFRYSGIFPPYTKLLKNVDFVSEYYLHT